ncbi:Predicted branched-chain amino acid permease (azaleucine resistance) [Rhizobium sp. RU20A]|uniref:AzlC family ABC transporter permease n=1 Tax=Rhizobium sp. RU20A TaxID=1907412 RepID=UPI00095404A1|nr:AzlC family ABC transporter permease [Rhizobium sp. RU20A]SIQ00792.1 Predicted branched-chain amino acid permease (azaleucine resistance) [Rhizobium sp. RU20A]
MTTQTSDGSAAYWFVRGAAGLFSLPGVILMLSFVGFAAFCVETGMPRDQVVFMVGIVWALPAKMILVSSIASGANIAAAFLAVTLSSIRMMPMVAALVPEIRGQRTRTASLLALSHTVAITAWVYAMQRVPEVPRDRRVVFCAGLGITLVVANMVLVGIVYNLVVTFPPILAGCLFFLTPVYFLASIWASARQRVIHVALVVGLIVGPIATILAPELDILIAGLVGGTLAWAIERAMRQRSMRASATPDAGKGGEGAP